MKQPREIIANHKTLLALDKLADDLFDMKKEIEESVVKSCLKNVKEQKRVTKINVIKHDYETGKEIINHLISYFELSEDTTDEEIAQLLVGLLDLVKLQFHINGRHTNNQSILSQIRRVLWWYSIKLHIYCQLKTIEPDDLRKEKVG